MANTILESRGWLSSDGTVLAYDRTRYPGSRPLPGERPAASITSLASASVDAHGYATLTVPAETALWLTTATGRRWVAAISGASEESTEQERAEGAEALIEQQIEQLRNEAPGSARMIFGINSNLAAGHAAYWTGSRVFGDRSNNLDVKYDTAPATVSAAVAASLAAGCKYPLVIINVPNTTVLGSVSPSAYAAGALAIIERVTSDHPTVTTYELINEPYYKNGDGSKITANGPVYGALVAAAYEAVKAAGLLGTVSLLVAAFGEYNSLSNESTGVQSGVFKKWIPELATALAMPYGAVIGDATTTYTNTDTTESERGEAYIFTCRRTGPVSEISLRTNNIVNANVSSVRLGIATDNAGVPGTLLAEGVFSGQPAINSWVTVVTAPVTLTAGAKYHLIIMPLGGSINYMAAVPPTTAGTGNVETKTGKKYSTIAGAITGKEWTEVFNQGPIGFMAGVALSRPLAADINGWTNHPYGTLSDTTGFGGNFNWGSTQGYRTEVAGQALGGNSNWWLTEFGWKVEAEQTANMQPFLEKALAAFGEGWLKGVYAYDDGDDGWSLYAKPGGEVLRTFAKSHG